MTQNDPPRQHDDFPARIVSIICACGLRAEEEGAPRLDTHWIRLRKISMADGQRLTPSL